MNVTKIRAFARRYGNAGLLIAGAWLLWHTAVRRWKAGLFVVIAGILPAALLIVGTRTPSTPSLSLHALRQPLRVTVLDVGKGDALVLETPSGKCLVVDTGGTLSGGSDRGRTVVAPFLRSHKRKRLDLLLLTHPHPDHVGGAATLLEQFPVALLVDNGLDSTAKAYKRYREVAEKRRVPCVIGARGWCYDCGDGVVLRALAPPPTGKADAPIRSTLSTQDVTPADNSGVNNSSLVLRVEYGKTAFLLTGDAETDSENDMLRARQPLACDVLKVGHHGSKKSSSAAFLKAAHPHYAIISVNANNRSHPAPEVLERLRAVGAQIFRTDERGHISALSDGRSIQIETAKHVINDLLGRAVLSQEVHGICFAMLESVLQGGEFQ